MHRRSCTRSSPRRRRAARRTPVVAVVMAVVRGRAVRLLGGVRCASRICAPGCAIGPERRRCRGEASSATAGATDARGRRPGGRVAPPEAPPPRRAPPPRPPRRRVDERAGGGGYRGRVRIRRRRRRRERRPAGGAAGSARPSAGRATPARRVIGRGPPSDPAAPSPLEYPRSSAGATDVSDRRLRRRRRAPSSIFLPVEELHLVLNLVHDGADVALRELQLVHHLAGDAVRVSVSVLNGNSTVRVSGSVAIFSRSAASYPRMRPLTRNPAAPLSAAFRLLRRGQRREVIPARGARRDRAGSSTGDSARRQPRGELSLPEGTKSPTRPRRRRARTSPPRPPLAVPGTPDLRSHPRRRRW